MYNHFFGFKEKPFRLVPNPDYLFLSRSHEEALAHLKYAAKEGEGFVEIIGEVGTGKTMLCRAFLEKLEADVESAYIFNPRMNATDLIKSINDEFGIPSDPADTKSLIDALNTFLMKKKAEGKKVILLIDEAQNLSAEVLEQVRLLSNLETTKEKLLQIILVGQPELGEMLDSYALRQIGQRISLRCRLKPLSYAETSAYIRHRIQVASRKPAALFSRSAIRRIWRYTHGIPRLINIACDRALLAAYGLNRHKITGGIAKAAVFELSSRGEIKRDILAAGQKRLAILFLLGLGLFAVLFYQSEIRGIIAGVTPRPDRHLQTQTKKPIPVVPQPVAAPPAPSRPVQTEAKPENTLQPAAVETAAVKPPAGSAGSSEVKDNIPVMDLRALLETLPAQTTRPAALETVLQRWGTDGNISADLNGIQDDDTFFSLTARQNGLFVQRITGDCRMVFTLNLCAIFKFTHPDKPYPIYLTLIRADKSSLTFVNSETGRSVDVPRNEIEGRFTGTAYVFWKNFYNYQGTIPLNSPKESILALKMQLRKMGFDGIGLTSDYDLLTQLAVKAIQAKYGIPVDGYVGPLTKIVLYNATPALAVPHLRAEDENAGSIPDTVAPTGNQTNMPKTAPERDGEHR